MSDELFRTMREFHEVEGKYWLSSTASNWYFGIYAGAWSSLPNQGVSVPATRILELSCEIVWGWERVSSPPSDFSILTTSAPRSESIIVAEGTGKVPCEIDYSQTLQGRPCFSGENGDWGKK